MREIEKAHGRPDGTIKRLSFRRLSFRRLSLYLRGDLSRVAFLLFLLPALMCTAICSPLSKGQAASATHTQQKQLTPQFFDSLYDVPVMPGLLVLPEESLTFDKAEGRIAQAAALAGDVPSAEIGDFYRLTLGQMGWRERGNLVFFRGTEMLQVFLDRENGRRVVRFNLKPR